VDFKGSASILQGCIVFATLIAAVICTSAQPQGHQVQCKCTAAEQEVVLPLGLECFSNTSASSEVVGDGKCNKPGCISQSCQCTWQISGTSVCGEPQYFINGLASTPPTNWSYDSGSGAFSASGSFSLACEDSGSVAVGFDDAPAVEFNFGCGDCD
jgi:hypothetical protein